MTKTVPPKPEEKSELKDILAMATEQTVQLARQRAAAPVATAPISRERACLTGLLVTAPLFALLLVVNVWGVSLVDLLTPSPTPAVAREQVQGMLDGVVEGIESFRQDYGKLPKELVEVGVPPRGSWTYLPKPGGRYQVVGAMYGQVVIFESPERTLEHERRR